MKRSLGLNTIGQDWWEAAAADVLLNAGRTDEALARAQQIAAGSHEMGLLFRMRSPSACGPARSAGSAATWPRSSATSESA